MPDSESEQNSERGSLVTGWKKVVFLFLAAVFFVLGAAGAILPGLPGTPFLLLTSYLLLRSFPSLNNRLLRSRLFGPILKDWQQRGGVRRDIKVKAIVIVIAAVGTTLWFSRDNHYLCALTVSLATIGVIVVLRLPTVTDSEDGTDS